MEAEKRALNLHENERFYNPAIYYAPVLMFILMNLKRSEASTNSVFLFSILFLIPFLVFSIFETYLYLKKDHEHASMSKKILYELWFVLIGCVLMCVIWINLSF